MGIQYRIFHCTCSGNLHNRQLRCVGGGGGGVLYTGIMIDRRDCAWTIDGPMDYVQVSAEFNCGYCFLT